METDGERSQPGDGYRIPEAAGLNSLEYADFPGAGPLRVAVIGGCMTQFAADVLERMGRHNGFAVETRVSWPTHIAGLDGFQPDLVVLQLSTTWLLGPLWDGGAAYDDAARAEMAEFIKEACGLAIGEARGRFGSALLLVHGFSRPMVSPLGLHEFRHEYHFDRIIFEINEHIRRLLREDPGAMFLDEERIFGNAGKRRLLDHLVAPFSHHGPLDMAAGPPVHPTRDETFGLDRPLEATYLLAREYLDHYVAWRGTNRIKCVITDLDHTLWPRVIGEEGLDLDDPELQQSLVYGVWAGIHQALDLVKRRGVLLAVASRNNRDVVMAEWRRLAEWGARGEVDHLLVPDDFVMHEIHWGPKSESVARILSALGVAAADALFIDDHAAERAEVAAAHPGIHVLGDNLNLVRGYLLTSPRLQQHRLTAESAQRTTLVKAQLQREATRQAVGDRRAFMAGLGIVIRVSRLGPGDDLHRALELMQRTNQFNIALRRPTIDELQALVREPGASVLALEVSDRFGAYGTVGLCILQGDEVTDFVMSCRVIGLCPEVPFLRAALLLHGRPAYRGRIVEGPRNQPCRALFREAGFSEGADGAWVLPDLSALKAVDEGVYTVLSEPRAATRA